MQAHSFLIKLSIVLALCVASTAHASVSVQCTAPNSVQCVVSEPQGIKKITVRADSGGTLVDNSYACVSTVTVAFGASPSSQLEVTTCGPDGLPPEPADGYGEPAYTYSLVNGVIRREESTGSIDTPRPGLIYAARYQLRTDLRQLVQLPLLIAYLAADPPQLADTYQCCGATQCVDVNPLASCGKGLVFLTCNDIGFCQIYPN